MRRASYSLLSKITSNHSRICSSCRVLSRGLVSDITPIPSKENPSPFSHTHHKSCNRTHGLLLLNSKTNPFQHNPCRDFDTLVDKPPQLSSRQRKKKEKSDIEEEFESAKTTDEILRAFSVMESAFDENDMKLGLACLKVGLQLDQEGGKPDKTLEFANKALNIFDKNDKGFSLPVAMTLQLMGSASYALKKFSDSLGYFNRASRILSKLETEGYGKDDIGPVMHAVQLGLANTKTAMGRHEEALVSRRKCLELKEKVLEPNSREMGVAHREMAEAYVAVLNLKEALPHCLKALEIHKAQLGDNSVEVARDRRLLGVCYTGVEEHQKAIEQNELSRKVLKNWNLDSELFSAELEAANIQIAMGKHDQAIDLMSGVVQRTEKESKTRASIFVAMANALCSQNKFSEATRCLQISSSIFEKKEPDIPVEVAEAYAEIALIYETMNDFELGISFYKRALAIFEKQPQELVSEGGVSARLGWLLLLTGQVPQALPYLEKAAEMLVESFGSKHFAVGYVYNNLGAAHLELDRPQSAAQMFALAKEIMDVALGPHHVDSIDACQNLSKAYGAMGSYALAMEFQQKVIDAYESHGPEARDDLREAQRLLEQLKRKARGRADDEVTPQALTLPRCAEDASTRSEPEFRTRYIYHNEAMVQARLAKR